VTLPDKEMENNVALKRELMTRLQDLKAMELDTQADLYRQRESLSNKTVQVHTELAALDARNIELQRQATAMQRIRLEVGVLEPSYEVLLRKREEARMAGSIQDSALRAYVSTLGRASIPSEPVFPRKPWLLLGGLFVGLACGCSVALLLEQLTNTMRRPADVDRVLRLPVLLSLPKVNSAARRDRGAARGQPVGKEP
jgi:polysaccharide biosynthesis transport protein